MQEKACDASAGDVFKDLVESSLALIDELPSRIKDPRAELLVILEEILRSDKSGQASPENSSLLPINFIPGEFSGQCHPILFGSCYKADDFKSRLGEILDRSALSCRGRNRLVAIFTTQWDTALWKDLYLRQFEQVPATVHIFLFGASGILSHIV